MTFEEFFQKKRISLTALQAGEPDLFAEFKIHFEKMGEKSFDHTKKYWFNKLRQTYHLPPEQKPEKMHLENRLAEQTIVDTLTDTIPTPSVGFKPKFSAAVVKPADETTDQNADKPIGQNAAAETPDQNSAVAEKPAAKAAGFKPRFNPKMVTAKAVDEFVKPDDTFLNEEVQTETPAPEQPEASVAKPAGFKPRFNAKMVAPKPIAAEEGKTAEPPAPVDSEEVQPAEPTAKPSGFKPRFNAKMVTPKPEEGISKKEEVKTAEEPVEQIPAEPAEAAPKPAGFKPRFNMKMVAPKVEAAEKAEDATAGPVSDHTAEPVTPTTETPADESTGVEQPAIKPAGFKPRFNAAKMKPKPPQE
ncbi:hypothetical protein A0256_02175 [Mucilaginibacter sp. PAMC 26640]|nr:hypothetical protein A0256_02175 [Mucilaginibacter sp. PAMC 26640]